LQICLPISWRKYFKLFALTHSGHDCDGEEEGLWESPPHVPAVDGAVVVVVLGSVDHEGDEAAQVRVALVLKSETKILRQQE
jgi:hypothetical protein